MKEQARIAQRDLAGPLSLPLMAKTRIKNVVGLDIEPGFVAAVEARDASSITVDRAASVTLDPGVVRDGEVVDVDALAGVLRELFKEHKLPKRVRLGVANQRIVVRTIDLPPVTDAKEIAAAVRYQAQEHIPMPLDQAVLEHQALGIVETADGPRARVVLVAARRDMIERLLGAARQAGLRPEGIDLSAFAMIRALGTDVQDGNAVLYMAIGGITNLAIADGPRCLFTRVVATGLDAMVADLGDRRGLTREHASEWVRHVGLTTPLEDLTGEAEVLDAARDALEDGVRRVADEVRNSLDFYRMQDSALPVQRAVLTGPAVAVPGFAERLSDEIGIEVKTGLVTETKPGAFGGVDAGRLSVAAGLSVGERSS